MRTPEKDARDHLATLLGIQALKTVPGPTLEISQTLSTAKPETLDNFKWLREMLLHAFALGAQAHAGGLIQLSEGDVRVVDEVAVQDLVSVAQTEKQAA